MAKTPVAKKNFIVTYFRKRDLNKARAGESIALRTIEVEASSPEEATTKASTPARTIVTATPRKRGKVSKVPGSITVEAATSTMRFNDYANGTAPVSAALPESPVKRSPFRRIDPFAIPQHRVPGTPIIGSEDDEEAAQKVSRRRVKQIADNLVPDPSDEIETTEEKAPKLNATGRAVEALLDEELVAKSESEYFRPLEVEPGFDSGVRPRKRPSVRAMTPEQVQLAVDRIAPDPEAEAELLPEEVKPVTKAEKAAEELLGDDPAQGDTSVPEAPEEERAPEPTEEELAQKAENERQEAITKIDKQIEVLTEKIEDYEVILDHQRRLAEFALNRYVEFADDMQSLEDRLNLRPLALDRLEQVYGQLPVAVKEDDSFDDDIAKLKDRVDKQNFDDACRSNHIERYEAKLNEAIATVQGLTLLRAELTGTEYVDPFAEPEEDEIEEAEPVSYITLHPLWLVLFILVALASLTLSTVTIGERLIIGTGIAVLGLALANAINERRKPIEFADDHESPCDCCH